MSQNIDDLILNNQVNNIALSAALAVLNKYPDGLSAYRGYLLAIAEKALAKGDMQTHNLLTLALNDADDAIALLQSTAAK